MKERRERKNVMTKDILEQIKQGNNEYTEETANNYMAIVFSAVKDKLVTKEQAEKMYGAWVANDYDIMLYVFNNFKDTNVYF
jgi:hypothetical protein